MIIGSTSTFYLEAKNDVKCKSVFCFSEAFTEVLEEDPESSTGQRNDGEMFATTNQTDASSPDVLVECAGSTFASGPSLSPCEMKQQPTWRLPYKFEEV